MTTCISQPISWLRLEQYALDELTEGRDEIAAHLAACEACRACLARIESDAKLDLPPLPATATATATVVRPAWRRALVASGSALALAAAAVLAIGRVTAPPPDDGERVKGAAIAFSLVRDDDALIAEAGGTYKDGDRFKAIVTCPPGARLRFDLVVYDGAGAQFPLDPAQPLACGNEVPMRGAFRLTGTAPLRVCLVWSENDLERNELLRAGNQAAFEGANARGT